MRVRINNILTHEDRRRERERECEMGVYGGKRCQRDQES